MTIDNKLFDDLTRMASGAANIMTGIGKQIGSGLKDQLKDQMSGKFAGFPFAPFAGFGGGDNGASGESDARDETAPNDLNRLLGLMSQYRLEQEAIKERLSVIEKALGIDTAPLKSPASRAAKDSKPKKAAKSAEPAKSSKTAAKPKMKKSTPKSAIKSVQKSTGKSPTGKV